MKTPVLALALASISAFLAGCSPPADPIAKASAHYLVDFPQSAGVGGACNGTAQAAIASDESNTADLPLAQSEILPTDFGHLVSNGRENSISCTVQRVSDGYNISMYLAGPNVSPTAGSAIGETRLRISNAFIGDDGVGTGRVVVNTTNVQQVSPNLPCQLRAIPDPQDSSLFQMREGEARFVFVCPDTTSSLDDFSTCETRGTVWVDDCLEK